jgi:hypothetical protein
MRNKSYSKWQITTFFKRRAQLRAGQPVAGMENWRKRIEAVAGVLQQLPKTERAKVIATVENSTAALVGTPTNA